MGQTLAVTSGKGGVGKSCIAVNLAVVMARMGRSTLLVDADFGLGNSALLLGCGVENSIEHVLRGECRAEEVAVEGPDGLVLLPASANGQRAGWELGPRVGDIRADLSSFEAQFDYVIVDTGAGLVPKTIEAAVAVQRMVLVATPEPTAIADSYATMKALLVERSDLAVHLVINMAESQSEAEELQDKFAELTVRFLGAQIDNRGYIPFDRYVREAAKRQVPFAQIDPPSPAAEAIERLSLWFDNNKLESRSAGFFDSVLGWEDADWKTQVKVSS